MKAAPICIPVLAACLLIGSVESKGQTNRVSPNLARSGKTASSSTWPGYPASGAADGVRYGREKGQYWCGARDDKSWWWEVDLGEPRPVAKVFLVMGSREFERRYAPTDYTWQCCDDGRNWVEIPGAAVKDETRLFRIQPFSEPVTARYFRIMITKAFDGAPALREVELYSDEDADVEAAPWFYSVNVDASGKLPGSAVDFVKMARRCPGWEDVRTQYVQAADFREGILAAEPKPLCAFLSGAVGEWCMRRQEDFAGVEEVVKKRSLPMWGSCGGGQLLLILDVHGTGTPWICPHCEWNRPERFGRAEHPFVYGHIACKGKPKCGEYPCEWEKGTFPLVRTRPDPVLRFLPETIHVYQNHCGEIRRLTESWVLVATKGPGGKTSNQLMRVRDHLVYAAQFHVEDSGRDGLVMIRNFLNLAKGASTESGSARRITPLAPSPPKGIEPSATSGFGGVWWLDTPGVRKGDWNGVVTLFRVGDLLGGYYRNGDGVGVYCGKVGSGGEAEGETWWERGSERGLWRFRYAVSEDGTDLVGGSRDFDGEEFTKENGVRIEGGGAFEDPGRLPLEGRISYTTFGPFTGFWRTECPRVEAGVQDAILRLKQRGTVAWGYTKSPLTRGFGFLLGVVGGKGKFTGRFWWGEKGSYEAYEVEFTLAEGAESFRGRYRPPGGGWKSWNGKRTY